MPDRDDEYASFAGAYDVLTAPFLAPARRMVRRALARFVPHGGRVLDLGCGTGVLAHAMAADGFRVVCLDASASMLGRAASASMLGQTVPSSGLCRIRGGRGAARAPLVRGDAAAMPLPDDAFAACTTVMVLHEMDPDIRREALGEIMRVLAPGGLLLAVDYMAPARAGHASALLAARLPERAAGPRHYGMFRRFVRGGGLAGVLRGAGLRPRLMGRCLLGAAGLVVARVEAVS